MSRPPDDPALPISRLEEAELRRLVYRAFLLRNGYPAAYRQALEEIESWHVETLPGRIARLEGRRAQ